MPTAFATVDADKVRFNGVPFDMRIYNSDGSGVVYAIESLHGGRAAARAYQDHYVPWVAPVGLYQSPSDPASFVRSAGPVPRFDAHGNVVGSGLKSRRPTANVTDEGLAKPKPMA